MKKNFNISLILATRNRPIQAINFLNSAFIKCAFPDNIEVIMFVDDDDNNYDDFMSPFLETRILRGPRKNLPFHLRACAEASKSKILFFVNDDSVVETFGWDSKIIDVHNSVEDSIYLCYPNDCFKGKELAVFPVLSKFCYNTFELLPTIYKGAFSDTHIHEIFHLLSALGHNRLFYQDSIIVRHNHYRTTGEKPDKTYTDRARFGDDLTFLKGVAGRFRMANMIKDFIEDKKNIIPKNDINMNLGTIGSSVWFYIFIFPKNLNYRIKLILKLSMRFFYSIILRKH